MGFTTDSHRMQKRLGSLPRFQMKRPAFVGFSSEESEVAEQTPLEKRKLQVLLLLIEFVHCARLRSLS